MVIEDLDVDNLQCYLAAFESAYQVFFAATLDDRQPGPARCRAVLTDMRRRLDRELKKVDYTELTFFQFGLDHLVESLWQTLNYPPRETSVCHLGERVSKAGRILATLIRMVQALISMEMLQLTFDDE
ncbi:MAG: hypothetical protein OEU26_15155 [Candidatus Tectomicrobia bacterium]|nr:hypothetical protein [Candidatus Tectomicrobia bacterium]